MILNEYVAVALTMAQSLKAAKNWRPEEYQGDSFKCDSFFTQKAKNRRRKKKKGGGKKK